MSTSLQEPSGETVDRRAYQRDYQRELRQRRKRVEVLFEFEDYERLQQAAIDHNLKVATFVRAAALAYLGDRYIVPVPERVAELEVLLRQIITNLERLTRRHSTEAEGGSLVDHVVQLEEALSAALRQPPSLLDLVEEQVRERPEAASLIQSRLDQLSEEHGW